MSIGDKIRVLRKAKKMTTVELASVVGLSDPSISQFENGKRVPRIETMRKIADALGVDVAYFFQSDTDGKNTEVAPVQWGKNMLHIPVYDATVAAGAFRDSDTDAIAEYIDLPRSVCSDHTARAVRVQGDSMEPRVSAGDIVVFSDRYQVRNGMLVVVMIDNEGLALKKAHFPKDDPKTVILSSENPKYPPRAVKRKDIVLMHKVIARVSTF